MDDALATLREERDEPSGPLRINVSRIAAFLCVAPILRRFTAAHPAMRLEMGVDDELAVAAALDGVGLACVLDPRVLGAWCPPFPGFYLYHPSHRQTSAALRALVAMLRGHA